MPKSDWAQPCIRHSGSPAKEKLQIEGAAWSRVSLCSADLEIQDGPGGSLRVSHSGQEGFQGGTELVRTEVPQGRLSTSG